MTDWRTCLILSVEAYVGQICDVEDARVQGRDRARMSPFRPQQLDRLPPLTSWLALILLRTFLDSTDALRPTPIPTDHNSRAWATQSSNAIRAFCLEPAWACQVFDPSRETTLNAVLKLCQKPASLCQCCNEGNLHRGRSQHHNACLAA